MNTRPFITAALLLLISGAAFALEYFPLQQVRLLGGPFRDAQDRNIAYVLAMDPDRLLAPYLTEAGLAPRAKNYGNWESTGLNGHIGGHYLSALSLAAAATAREDVRERIDYVLHELARAQRKNGNGYLGGVPGSDELWSRIAVGDIDADLFALNGAWVPWYNLHKVFAGLRDAWLYTGSELARDMLVARADWAGTVVAGLDDDELQFMLRTEHGGMNEVLADVAAITGDERYLVLAQRFSHRQILDPLIDGEDRLTGLHANTQIPKVVGFERIAQLAEDDDWQRAANFFWQVVVNDRSVAIGGNSVREHFHDKADFGPMIDEIEGPETCNTYNMLRLTRMLYAQRPALAFVDYYERGLYNHILSSQDPLTGGLVYFTPMRPQHYRVYSSIDDSMWCCVGSGIENHVRYGEFIYARNGDELYVNLYIASRVDWPERGFSLRQENRFPDEAETRLVFEEDADVRLKLRYPSWASGNRPQLAINGERQDVSATPGTYIELKREWKKGDTVSLQLPMDIHAEQLPDGSDYYAILYGPIVLAAKTSPFADEQLGFYSDDGRMGHIPDGPLCPVEQVPLFLGEQPDFAAHVTRIDDDELRFRIDRNAGLRGLGKAELIPFFRLHQSRYMMYWPFSTPAALDLRLAHAEQAEAAAQRIESLTIDKVAPGEQQPEAEHAFEGKGSEAGVNFGRHWRHASGWFAYTLADEQSEARFLRVDYWGADQGRSFTIEVNGVVVAKVTLNGELGPNFVSVDYPLSDVALAGTMDGRHRIAFVAAADSIAGGIYGVRLLRELPDSAEHATRKPH
jgi:DUF1680 family protein